MEASELRRRFAYHPPSREDVKQKHEKVRDICADLALFVSELPGGDTREKSLAITKIEEAMMWANAHIARHQDIITV